MKSLANLLTKLQQAYEASELRSLCLKENYKWGYSLITGRCVPDALLIIGYNWGAKSGEKYRSQEAVKTNTWRNQDLGSLARIVPYCEKYLPQHELDNASQTNYCFFRSRNESQIKPKDLELCRPIFYELLSVMKPSTVLCLSSKLRDHMHLTDQIKRCKKKPIKYTRGSREVEYSAMKGELATGTRIVFLPHPNYPIKRSVRDAAWRFCLGRK